MSRIPAFISREIGEDPEVLARYDLLTKAKAKGGQGVPSKEAFAIVKNEFGPRATAGAFGAANPATPAAGPPPPPGSVLPVGSSNPPEPVLTPGSQVTSSAGPGPAGAPGTPAPGRPATPPRPVGVGLAAAAGAGAKTPPSPPGYSFLETGEGGGDTEIELVGTANPLSRVGAGTATAADIAAI